MMQEIGFEKPLNDEPLEAGGTPEDEGVKIGRLQPEQSLPVLFHATDPHLKLAGWAKARRELIEDYLLKHGAILFRNFNVESPAEFEDFIQAVSGDLLEYNERASPRSQVSGNIYTSTDHPASQTIFIHNENSFKNIFNRKIFFYCMTPSEKGGETPIADCRRVFDQISPEVRQRFIEQGWMYVRNYGDGFGLPWQDVFQTSDRQAVEEHCRKNNIQVEWKDGNRLRTRASFPAVLTHPLTKEEVWFNHATFFHVSTLELWVQEAMREEFDRDEDMPTNTFYGDGSPIEPAVLEELRAAYRQHTTSFLWQERDVLMVDNLLVAHGRAPYVGARKILVGMSEPTTREELSRNFSGE